MTRHTCSGCWTGFEGTASATPTWPTWAREQGAGASGAPGPRGPAAGPSATLVVPGSASPSRPAAGAKPLSRAARDAASPGIAGSVPIGTPRGAPGVSPAGRVATPGLAWLTATIWIWGLAAVTFAFFAGIHQRHDARLPLLHSGAMLGLALVTRRGFAHPRGQPRPGPGWGTLGAWALVILPAAAAMALEEALLLYVGVPALAFLAHHGLAKRPLLAPASPAHALVVVALTLVAGTTVVEAGVGLPRPPPVDVSGSFYVSWRERKQVLVDDAGRIRAWNATTTDLPWFSVVSLTLRRGADLDHALQQTFAADGSVSSLPVGHGWRRVELSQVYHDAWFLFWSWTDFQYQVLLLRHVDESVRPTIVPPFVQRWDTYAGYHLASTGNYSEFVQRVSGHVSVAGVALDLPPESLSGARIGEGRTVPATGVWVIAALLVLVAEFLRRRGPRGIPEGPSAEGR